MKLEIDLQKLVDLKVPEFVKPAESDGGNE